jgi:hypothetical protein
MPRLRRILAALAAGLFLCALAAHGQDAPPSLGDAARQARLQKHQQKDAEANQDAPAKDAPSKDVQSKDTPAKDAQLKDGQPKDAQAKDAQAKGPQAPKVKRVITNDEIPEHIGPTSTMPVPQTQGATYDPQQNSGGGQGAAESWKTQILAQKNYLASLQNQITALNDSIHYAGGNCVSGCVQWNERQQQKQQQVETMKSQLEQGQKRLEDLQEMARKQGFGSSVYDP